ncbi:MAG: hypothetical protein GX112_12970 [Clostridiaceae bacterium]|nr:hypothetical protein [Clostridiaceae bacterium]
MGNQMAAAQKRKTILIVIDGLDYAYIAQHSHAFSLFRTLLENNRLNRLESVVPGDSIPAWITIYTGLNPATHGVIESIDYMNFKSKSAGDYSQIKGHCIWDELSRRGRKVLVFNPFLAYPAWDVNGLMISGPVFESGRVTTNKADQVDLADLPSLGGLVDHPSKKAMNSFLSENLKLTREQFSAFRRCLSRETYDFAFLGILTADRIQHFLWRFADDGKHAAPKSNRLSGAIKETYLLMENMIGEILNEFGDAYHVIVISDHGHGPRCRKTFYINQWLINERFICEADQKKRAVEYAKHAVLLGLEKMHAVEAGVGFFKRFAFAHKVKNAGYLFKAKGACYAPHFDGTNPYGGIRVFREAFSSDEAYEAERIRIISGLLKVRDAGKPVIIWAKRGEDIYPGSRTDHYPEIVYCMDPEYGVDRGLFGKRLFGSNAFCKIISGGHRSSGVIAGNADGTEHVVSILNVYDYILGLC